jgi:CheY-like chemotaxis protein
MNGKPKILAVDDEEFNLDIMDHHLTRADYEVVRAEDGVAALAMLEENDNIDVIVLDRMMPKLGGMEVLAKIKVDDRFKEIPVVMQTAAAAADQVTEGIKAGVYYYLTKPYDGDTLVSIVNAALRDARSKRQLQEKLSSYNRILGLMKQAHFQFRTLDEAISLAYYLANCYPEPQRVVFGLHELLINAVEHGNLGITYAEKSRLVRDGVWKEEVDRRLAAPQYRNKVGSLTFDAAPDAIVIHIKDEGAGFDWSKYLEFCPQRATDPHGRGIAASRAMSFDTMEYLGAGNEVRCVVNIPAASNAS